MKMKLTALALFFVVLFIILLPSKACAATTPSLGTAATFGILSSTFTRNVGLTAITGDLSYTTLSGSGTHTVSGTTTTPKSTQAGTDQASALTALNAQTCDFTFGSDTVLSSLSQPLTPGVYCITGVMSIGTGGITLTSGGTYIFRSTGAFNTVNNSNVVLGSASACDVFWTSVATTLGANTTFAGTVIDNTAITVGSTTSWTGRALDFATTVTTDTDTITVPTCVTPTSTPTPTSVPGATPTPTPTVDPSVTPTTGSSGSSSTNGQSNSGSQTAAPVVGLPNTGMDPNTQTIQWVSFAEFLLGVGTLMGFIYLVLDKKRKNSL